MKEELKKLLTEDEMVKLISGLTIRALNPNTGSGELQQLFDRVCDQIGELYDRLYELNRQLDYPEFSDVRSLEEKIRRLEIENRRYLDVIEYQNRQLRMKERINEELELTLQKGGDQECIE